MAPDLIHAVAGLRRAREHGRVAVVAVAILRRRAVPVRVRPLRAGRRPGRVAPAGAVGVLPAGVGVHRVGGVGRGVAGVDARVGGSRALLDRVTGLAGEEEEDHGSLTGSPYHAGIPRSRRRRACGRRATWRASLDPDPTMPSAPDEYVG